MNIRTQPGAPVTTVAGYLLTRLAELGVASIFGVPGDDNLGLLDAITARPSLAWLGMASEQGAGYAASSYARLRGLGALVTTFGAGELSALNAIASANAERVPVVHIVGTPALAASTSGATSRHNLPGAQTGHLARIAAEVTAAQADLRPHNAPAEIDRVLSTALRTSRPVYFTIPADVASTPVTAPVGRLPNAAPAQPGPAQPWSAEPRSAEPRLAEPRPADEDPRAYEAPTSARDRGLTEPALWASLRHFLQSDDLLIADRNAASHRAVDQAQLVAQPLWASGGWAVPAVLGASLAAPDRRVIMVATDAAVRQAAAELGTLLGQGLVPILIVLDHSEDTTEDTAEAAAGDATERTHDTPAWDWTALLAAVDPAGEGFALRVHDRDELSSALNVAGYHAAAGRPVLIHAVLSADHALPMLGEPARILARP
jgi:TPP-dependent 2-oxoacid decarboxylase